MKLNLGCGEDRREGYVNVDACDIPTADQVWNLKKMPWPWKNNSIDEIVAYNILEHLGNDNRESVMKELWRICKNDAIIRIHVPHWKWFTMAQSQHTAFFNSLSFTGYDEDQMRNFDNCKNIHWTEGVRFKVIENKLLFKGPFKFIESFANRHNYFYEMYLSNMFPAHEIKFKLIVKKPDKEDFSLRFTD